MLCKSTFCKFMIVVFCTYTAGLFLLAFCFGSFCFVCFTSSRETLDFDIKNLYQKVGTNTSKYVREPEVYQKVFTNQKDYPYDVIKLAIRGPDVPELLIPNHLACSIPDLRYVAYIFSPAEGFQKRQSMRAIWVNREFCRRHSMTAVFILGKPANPFDQIQINEESTKYSDIIQGDFIDSYKNLTLKSITALKWISIYCTSPKLVLKIDDDVFIDFSKLTATVARHMWAERTFVCLVHDNLPILRDQSKCFKWCAKEGDFAGWSHYPRFCNGFTYAYTRDLVDHLYKAISVTPFFFLEDVYTTGLLPRTVPHTQFINIRNHTTADGVSLLGRHTSKVDTQIFIAHIDNATIRALLWESILKRDSLH